MTRTWFERRYLSDPHFRLLRESLADEWGSLLGRASYMADADLDTAVDGIVQGKSQDEIAAWLKKLRVSNVAAAKAYLRKIVASLRY